MASDFGSPIYTQDQQGTTASASPGPNGAAHDAPLNLIDENDPRLTSEDLTVNADADAYAMPAPPPEGIRLRGKLKILKTKTAGGQEVDYYPKESDTKGWYMCSAIDLTIIDATGKYDGMHVYDRWVSTMLNRENGTKISTILSKLKQPNGQSWLPKPGTSEYPKSHASLMKLFVRALAGEPEIAFEPQWEWSCPACGKDVKEAQAKGQEVDYDRSVVGMRKFPVDQEASKKAGRVIYIPEMECKKVAAHGWSRVQVRVGAFYPVV